LQNATQQVDHENRLNKCPIKRIFKKKNSVYSAITLGYRSNLKDPHIDVVGAGYGGRKSFACLGLNNLRMARVWRVAC